MEESFWTKLNRMFERVHLRDTEVKTSGESVFINPTIKFILGWGIFLVLLLLFLLIVKPFSKDTATTDDTIGKTQGEIISNEDYVPFEHNEYPEVNAFVESYLNALTSCDINLLSTMVVDPGQFNVDDLTKRQEYAESYSNVECYTKPGLTEGSYVVYALVNTQIPNVTVQPLSLHQFYLIPNENGGFLHDNTTTANPEIEAYMNQIDRDPDVTELFTRVEQNNTESAKVDDSLRQFYESIGVQIE